MSCSKVVHDTDPITEETKEQSLYAKQLARFILMSHWINLKDDMVLWTIPFWSLVYNFQKCVPHDKYQWTNFYSQDFIISTNHKFRLRLFPYGGKQTRGKFMSLYVQLLPNDLVKPPVYSFVGTLTFVIIDQTCPNKHHHQSCYISANVIEATPFSQNAYNSTKGLRRLISVDSINKYVTNNTLVIGVCMHSKYIQ